MIDNDVFHKISSILGETIEDLIPQGVGYVLVLSNGAERALTTNWKASHLGVELRMMAELNDEGRELS